MFGGLAFLVGGNMAIAASGQGGALVRVDPARSDRWSARRGPRSAVMQGRPMPGWLRVPDEELGDEQQIADWVRIGTDYARTLPAKP